MGWLGWRGSNARQGNPFSTRQIRPSLEQLEGRDLPDAVANLNFVAQAYRDLLGREADLGGLAAFSSAIEQGRATRATVALTIQQSPEYRQLLVQSLYANFLHRAADAGGLNAFTQALNHGATAEQVASLLVGSEEYLTNRGGGTTGGFLDALYMDALGRSVDPVGGSAFGGLLSRGGTRGQVASLIFGSPEHRQLQVESFYLRFLHRPPDPTGGSIFASQLVASGRIEFVIAAIVSSDEYAPGANIASCELALTAAEVGLLLDRAAAASASSDAIIAIVDRGGRPLGIRLESALAPAITGSPDMLTFAIDGALAKARTAAFFANNSGGGTPLTSRTIRFISQTTMTQREIESNPNDPDPNSTARGPGFVAPIGIGGHFPPNVLFTPQVDLFAIEHTNRDSIIHPGPDGIRGSADDIPLPNRFNVPDAFIPPGIPPNQQLTPPESYGYLSGIYPQGQSRGLGTLPGGIPIFKRDLSTGQTCNVGGIGVFFPGATGFASEENSALDQTYDPLKPDRSLEAEYIAFAAVAAAFPLDGVAPLPQIVFPNANGRIDLVGIQLDIVGPAGSNQGPDALLAYGRALGTGLSSDGLNVAVNTIGDTLIDGNLVPEGWLVMPHDGTGLTASDVVRIISQGIQQALTTRAAIRLPLDSRTRMVFAVSDVDGNVLGVYRMPDSTIFSIDVAVAKARNVAYYANSIELQAIDQVSGVPAGTAMTNRTFRYLALPRFPEGIDGQPPGPFSILNDDPGTNRLNGLQVGPRLPASAFQSAQGYDAFFPGSNFHDLTTPANQNGVVFFPGSAPLYKFLPGLGQPVLVGGLGVSGDGVDQDDVVTAAAAGGYEPPPILLRADQVTVRGVRLPYQKFNRNPEG